MKRAAIESRVLAWLGESPWREDDARFRELALTLFAHQFEHCAPYRLFCTGRSRTPDRVVDWREIPPVPTGGFKEVALRCFPADRTVRTFRTSGTSTSRRGELHLDTLALYEASLLASFRRHVLPDLAEKARMRIQVLTASPAELPDSSLSHMFGCVLDACGAPSSGFAVRAGELDLNRLLAALEDAAGAGEPVALCGTAFAFAHLLDALAERGAHFALPTGSRAMETGGFKGRARELARDEFYAALEERLGVPAERIVNQYGMTELGSQFYDSVLLRPGEPRRKLAPPWTRVAILDPESGAERKAGEAGAIAIIDLANTGSVLAVQTADIGRRVGDGFEVLGREPGAEARGCSIAADELLGGAPA